MKKLEHFLFVPLLILSFYGASKYSEAGLDIHWNDTFYVISTGMLTGWYIVWLLLVIMLYKAIRKRQSNINRTSFIAYNSLSLLLFTTLLVLSHWAGKPKGIGYSTADLDNLILRNQLRVVAMWCFLGLQVIFLLHLGKWLLKKPLSTTATLVK